jgi:hypothetical protein
MQRGGPPGETASPLIPATPTARGNGRLQTYSFMLTRSSNLWCRLQPGGGRFFRAVARISGEKPYEGQFSSVAAELSTYTQSKLCDARRCDRWVLPLALFRWENCSFGLPGCTCSYCTSAGPCLLTLSIIMYSTLPLCRLLTACRILENYICKAGYMMQLARHYVR